MSSARQYELVYIVTPEATEQEIADLHTQIEQIVQRFNGTLRQDRELGPQAPGLRHRPSPRRQLRRRDHHRLGRADEGDRSAAARHRLRSSGTSSSAWTRSCGWRSGRPTRARRSWRGAAWRAACRRSASLAKGAATATRRTTWKGWRPSDEGRTRRRRRAAAAAATRRTARAATRRGAGSSGAGASASSARRRSTTSTTRTCGCWRRSCRSAARSSRGASRARARCTSASCRSRSSARASSR